MDKHLKSMGIELTDEQMKQIIRAPVQAGVDPEAFAEAMMRVVTVFVEVWQALREIEIIKDMRDQIDQIKEFIENHSTTMDTRPERKGWRISRKIIRDHQVFDRRPMVIYIRGEI